MHKEYLGKFTNESGSFIVSDPCYSLGIWCQGQLNDVATGTWKAYVKRKDEGDWGIQGDWGIRCAELIVEHDSVTDEDSLRWGYCSDFPVVCGNLKIQ